MKTTSSIRNLRKVKANVYLRVVTEELCEAKLKTTVRRKMVTRMGEIYASIKSDI